MADGKALPVTDPMAQINALLTTLGGTKTTSNPGDTSALRSTFAATQAFDPAALLQSIFQEAGGKIPGLQNAYGNAVGARRSGNSAIQNALNALLSQTTLAGQSQIVAQQNQNLQTQANVGANIAQATKGTTQKTSTDLGSAAKNMLLLQGLAKLADTGVGKQLFGAAMGSAVTPSAANPLAQTVITPEQYAVQGTSPIQGLEQFVAPTAQQGTADPTTDIVNLLQSFAQPGSPDFVGPPVEAATGDDLSNYLTSFQPSQVAPTADDLTDYLNNFQMPDVQAFPDLYTN